MHAVSNIKKMFFYWNFSVFLSILKYKLLYLQQLSDLFIYKIKNQNSLS